MTTQSITPDGLTELLRHADDGGPVPDAHPPAELVLVEAAAVAPVAEPEPAPGLEGLTAEAYTTHAGPGYFEVKVLLEGDALKVWDRAWRAACSIGPDLLEQVKAEFFEAGEGRRLLELEARIRGIDAEIGLVRDQVRDTAAAWELAVTEGREAAAEQDANKAARLRLADLEAELPVLRSALAKVRQSARDALWFKLHATVREDAPRLAEVRQQAEDARKALSAALLPLLTRRTLLASVVDGYACAGQRLANLVDRDPRFAGCGPRPTVTAPVSVLPAGNVAALGSGKVAG